jgi:hypothetical protein
MLQRREGNGRLKILPTDLRRTTRGIVVARYVKCRRRVTKKRYWKGPTVSSWALLRNERHAVSAAVVENKIEERGDIENDSLYDRGVRGYIRSDICRDMKENNE